MTGSERKAALQVGAESDEPVVFSEPTDIKAYSRSTVTDERFSLLSIFPIEQESSKFLGTSGILSEFAASRGRKVSFSAPRFVFLSKVSAGELFCFFTFLRLHSAAILPLTG